MTIALSRKEVDLFEKAKSFSISSFAPETRERADCNRSLSDAIKTFSDNGYCGLGLSSQWGGREYNCLEQVLIYEGLAYGNGVLSFLLQTHNSLTKIISTFGKISKEINALIPDMARGKKINAFALTEDGSGSDPLAIRSYAELKADGYHIHGGKIWVANAVEADNFIGIVKEGSADSQHILITLLDKNTPGLKLTQKRPINGLKALLACDMEFNGCIVPNQRVFTDKGNNDAVSVTGAATAFVPAILIGIAQRVIDLTVSYLGRRISFGHPIIKRQGVQWSLADLSSKVEAGRWLNYKAASLIDGKNESSLEIYMNKFFASKVAMEATTQCLQLFGAQGYAQRSELSKNWALTKLLQIVDGIPGRQMNLVTRNLEG